jgi:hypothetical protein
MAKLIWPHLHLSPINLHSLGKSMLKEIPLEELEQGYHYVGEGRFSGGLGLWNGELFIGFQCKFGRYLETSAIYGQAGFSPTKKVEV